MSIASELYSLLAPRMDCHWWVNHWKSNLFCAPLLRYLCIEHIFYIVCLCCGLLRNCYNHIQFNSEIMHLDTMPINRYFTSGESVFFATTAMCFCPLLIHSVFNRHALFEPQWKCMFWIGPLPIRNSIHIEPSGRPCGIHFEVPHMLMVLRKLHGR